MQKYYSLSILKFTYIFFTSLLLFIHISFKSNAFFQQDTIKTNVITDSVKVIKTDTLKKNSKQGQITDIIKAIASDSSFYDRENNALFLYGNARITYGEKEVDAGFIKVDYKSNSIFAK